MEDLSVHSCTSTPGFVSPDEHMERGLCGNGEIGVLILTNQQILCNSHYLSLAISFETHAQCSDVI